MVVWEQHLRKGYVVSNIECRNLDNSEMVDDEWSGNRYRWYHAVKSAEKVEDTKPSAADV